VEQSETPPLDLNEIALFARVVQAGTFSGAARKLRLPKSTVSRKVAALEERLGARLLQRTTRRLGLTDAGRAFYDYAARIVADIEEAGRAVHELQATPRGRLRVTVPMSQSFLGRTLATFLSRYPEVSIDVSATDRVVDLVEDRFDVGLRAGRLADSSLIARPISMLRRYVFAAPSYLSRRAAPLVPEDLKNHDCLLFGPTSPREIWTLEDGTRTVELQVPARLIANDTDMLRDVALAGLGLSLLPERSCAAELHAGRLVRVLPEWHAPDVPFTAVYPSTRHLSPKVSAFVELLQSELGRGM
jgi:DNA-binding transcriptional LysR family regulator